MFRIVGNTIHITRGDIASFDVGMKRDDGRDYEFTSGDVIRFKVFEAKRCSEVVLEKDFEVSETTTKVTIFLGEDETRIGELINKPDKYWYEVILNPGTSTQTLIGYDIDGEKVFMLYPEGGEKV